MSLSHHLRQQIPVRSNFQTWLFGSASPTWGLGSNVSCSSLPKAGVCYGVLCTCADHGILCTCTFGGEPGNCIESDENLGNFFLILSPVLLPLAPYSVVYYSSSYKHALFLQLDLLSCLLTQRNKGQKGQGMTRISSLFHVQHWSISLVLLCKKMHLSQA